MLLTQGHEKCANKTESPVLQQTTTNLIFHYNLAIKSEEIPWERSRSPGFQAEQTAADELAETLCSTEAKCEPRWNSLFLTLLMAYITISVSKAQGMQQPAARDRAASGKLSSTGHRLIPHTDEALSACRALWLVGSAGPGLSWLCAPSCMPTSISWPHAPSCVPAGSCCPRATCASSDHQSCPVPPSWHQDCNDLRWDRRGSPTAHTPPRTCNESISKHWAMIVAHPPANRRKETVAFPPLLSTD